MAAITLKDVAQACNLSRAAVSQVLRDPSHPEFPVETRQRVLSVAQKLNYVPSRIPGRLRAGTTNLLSLILPWNVPELMDVAERTANDLGFEVMIHFTPEPSPEHQREALMAALSWRADGIVWMPTDSDTDGGFSREVLAKTRATNAKLVLLENSLPGETGLDVVTQDDRLASEIAISHLMEKGYRRIVLLTACARVGVRGRRESVFVQVAKDCGVDPVVLYADPAEGAKGVLRRFFAQNKGVAAGFFCESDWYAIDLLKTAAELGLGVPKDVGVIALGDTMVGGRYHVGELVQPSLTAIYRPFGEMAKVAIETLVARVRAKGKAEHGRQIIVSQELVQRESTARV